MVLKAIAIALCAVLLGFSVPARVSAQTSPQVLEPAIGQLEVQINQHLRDILKSFGFSLPEWVAICTATQIKPGLVITASHCIIDDVIYIYHGNGESLARPWYPSQAARTSLPELAQKMDSMGLRLSERDVTTEPFATGYRIGFYSGNLNHVIYRNLDVVFSGFRYTNDDNYPQKSLRKYTSPDDALYQVDVATLAFRYGEKPYNQVFDFALGNVPEYGDTVESVGFSIGLRQWAGVMDVRGLNFLDNYGWIIALEYDFQVFTSGASGSIVWSPDRKVVGILTLGGPPGMLHNFTGLVPPGVIRMALDKTAEIQAQPEKVERNY
jgi:V8-like Glu-specific endopeptidase